MADITTMLQSADFRLLVPSVGIFLAVVAAVMGFYYLIRGIRDRRVKERLQDVIMLAESDSAARTIILRDMNMSSVPLLNALLMNAQWARRLDNLLVQGDIPMRVGAYFSLMLVVGAAAGLGAIKLTGILWLAPPAFVLFFAAPVFYARHRKVKRIRDFERQFPDALDMLTGALRAGLALSGAIQVVADESPDPVGREFSILSEETRLGLDMKEALLKLAGRVDSAELHLFVTAIIMQRETGGNLAEVLEGTAAVIRDRFRILGDVRAMTAHARLSGFILSTLPLGMAGIILFVAPQYLKGLWEDPFGPALVMCALALQVIGFLIMRRIVNIKV